MKKKWLAVGTGIVYDGDQNKLKLAIFRVMENGRAYPMLVKPSELRLDDLLFLETSDKSEYCFLEDFHLNENGKIDYWVFSLSEIPLNKQTSMMRMIQALLAKESSNLKSNEETWLVYVQQKPQETGNA